MGKLINCDKENLKLNRLEKTIGVDLGLKELLITSDGEFFENKQYLKNNIISLGIYKENFQKLKRMVKIEKN